MADDARTIEEEEVVAEDDLCPICTLLLYAPVRTTCNHILCRTCMSNWALASQTTPLHQPSALDLLDMRDFDPSYDPTASLEARCPMCRTAASAHPDAALSRSLEEKYPRTYAERRAEEDAAHAEENGADVENVAILVGNRHRLVVSGSSVDEESEQENKHDWTFFVRFSRPDLISYIAVRLHPTFRPESVVLREPPFEVRRIGWGFFSIGAVVVLKEGWEWISGGREVRGELTDRKGALVVQWTLDFHGEGRQGRMRAGVRRVAGYAVEGNGGSEDSPIRVPSPVEDGSPVRDVSPTRWPHMDEDEMFR